MTEKFTAHEFYIAATQFVDEALGKILTELTEQNITQPTELNGPTLKVDANHYKIKLILERHPVTPVFGPVLNVQTTGPTGPVPDIWRKNRTLTNPESPSADSLTIEGGKDGFIAPPEPKVHEGDPGWESINNMLKLPEFSLKYRDAPPDDETKEDD